MIDYDLNPPIRFQFEGDTDAARRRIPQARALMNQLIRRMEGGEVEALNWRVNTADGTFFEIHKYGTQHVALIRCPVIPVTTSPTEPVTPEFEREGNYLWAGARVLLPDFDPQTHPHIKVRDYSKTETLRFTNSRVSAEYYDSANNTGGRRPDFYEWIEYSPYYYGSYPYPFYRYKKKEEDYSNDVTKDYVPIKPIANLVLFEPGFNENANNTDVTKPTVLQSLDTLKSNFELPESTTSIDHYYASFSYESSAVPESSYEYIPTLESRSWARLITEYLVVEENEDGGLTVIGTAPTFTIVGAWLDNGPLFERQPATFTGDFVVETEANYVGFSQVTAYTGGGSFTSAPYIFKHGTAWDAHGFIAVGSPEADAPIKISRDVCYQPAGGNNEATDGLGSNVDVAVYQKTGILQAGIDSYDTPFALGGREWRYGEGAVQSGWIPDRGGEWLEVSSGAEWFINQSGSASGFHPAPSIDNASVITGIEVTSEIINEEAATVEYDETVEIDAKYLDGLYELRLSAGWISFPDTDFWDGLDVECELYIEVGSKTQTYTVNLRMANYSESQGWFDYGNWIANQEPTPFDESWYPGCWLIDIKNQTIIHETNPANLDRPWFTQ